MDVEQVPVGSILDQLGVTIDLDEGDLVSSAVVVMSVLVPGENNARLCVALSHGMGWIEQAGMLRLAERICSEPPEIEGD